MRSGVAEPVSVHVDTHGHRKVDEELLARLVRVLFPLTPAGISKTLKLKRPVYRQTARNGNFSRRASPGMENGPGSRASESASR
jgi:S-adenosylmethionine synthetase